MPGNPGGPGAPAFIYVAPRHFESARPALSGWMGHAAPFDFTADYAPAAGARRLPSVGANASASRQRAPNDQGVFNNFSSYGVNATAGWEVDLWGRASSNAQAAGYDAQGAELDRDAADGELRAAEGSFDPQWRTRAAVSPVGYYNQIGRAHV